MTSGSPHLSRSAGLDGLRGVAALAVLVTHATGHLGLLPWWTMGFTGVLVFFVLSGYLIGLVSMRSTPDRDGYRAFVRRRAVRLAPVILVVSLVVPALLVATGESPRLSILSGVQALTQTTGITTAVGVPMHESLLPTWSLTTEWTFYLLFPALVLVARHRGVSSRAIGRACAAAAVVLWVIALPLDPFSFYVAPVANVGVMCAGASLAMAHENGWEGPSLMREGLAPATGLALIVLFASIPGDNSSWAYRLDIMPAATLAALVVVHGVRLKRGVARVLSERWLGAVGIRAYSLYLWHVPCLWFAWRLFEDNAWAALGIGLASTVVVTAVSFNLLEQPVLRLRPPSRAGSSGAPV